MKYEIIFHPEAGKEYLDSLDWYERQLTGLGDRFKLAVLSQLAKISDNPVAYPTKKGRYRESNLKVFPYTIVYVFDDKTATIYISAIYHSSRSPGKKYRKMIR